MSPRMCGETSISRTFSVPRTSGREVRQIKEIQDKEPSLEARLERQEGDFGSVRAAEAGKLVQASKIIDGKKHGLN